MLDGTAGSISVTMMSPDSFTSVTCARNEPALICEDNRMPMVGLLALMLSGKWQSRCMMLVCEHRYHPHATPIEPDYDSLIRNIHEYPSGGHFVVLLLQCSSCSSIHIGLNVIPTVGLMPYNGPIPSPGISSTLLRLCWEAQQTFLQQQIWMYHAGRAGWAAQPEWAASRCQEMPRALTKTKTRKKRNNRESWLCVSLILFPSFISFADRYNCFVPLLLLLPAQVYIHYSNCTSRITVHRISGWSRNFTVCY